MYSYGRQWNWKTFVGFTLVVSIEFSELHDGENVNMTGVQDNVCFMLAMKIDWDW